MRHAKALYAALWLALWLSPTAVAKDEPSLNSRVTAALNAKAPEFKPIGGLDSGRIWTVPIEKTILVAVWQNSQSHSKDVSVSIYGVANRDDATAWLAPVRTKRVAAGWQVTTYRIGDEGYLSEHKQPERLEIQFRRGVVVVEVAGDNLPLVKEFADCILRQITATPIEAGSDRKRADSPADKHSSKGLSMSLARDESASGPSAPTQFTITFTNASQRTLSFAPGTTIHCGIRPSKTTWVKLNLTDPKGKLHRRMDYLGDGPPYVGTCAGRVEVFIVTLRPHESISLPLDLGKYVDLTDAKQFEMTRFPAGTYSLEAEFTSVWESPLQDKKTTWLGTVKSNTIQIQFASEFAAAYVEP